MGYQINLSKDITTFDVFKISLPMMVSALSNHFMLILDQVILSRYSIEAMTGAASASVWCAALQCAAMSITSISGAFVGNYNGAKKYDLAGNPVWQMIWFSLGLFAISVPLSMMAGQYCVPENLKTEGLPYFRILMFCAPITGVYYSLASFFISIGKGYIVTISSFLSNIINISLDIILVFGYFGIDILKGSVGAATGTVFAWASNVIILFIFFLKRKTRNKYGTFNFKLNISRLKEYLKLGISGGVGHVLELSAWGIIYYMLSTIGKETALLQSIAVSVNTLLAFTSAGLEKGTMAITANLLGAQLKHKIFSVLKKGITVHVAFCVCLSFIFFIFPEFIVNRFINFEVSKETINNAFLMLRLTFVYFLFDGCCWVIVGVIEAGGDIKYAMLTVASYIWGCVAIPVIILHRLGYLNILSTWTLFLVAIICVLTTLYHRYKSEKWIHIKV